MRGHRDSGEGIQTAGEEADGGAAAMMEQRLNADERQVLELLASRPHGATERLLVLAHGFDSDMIAGLVHQGLVAAKRESMKADRKTIGVVRFRITDAGRNALAGEG